MPRSWAPSDRAARKAARMMLSRSVLAQAITRPCGPRSIRPALLQSLARWATHATSPPCALEAASRPTFVPVAKGQTLARLGPKAPPSQCSPTIAEPSAETEQALRARQRAHGVTLALAALGRLLGASLSPNVHTAGRGRPIAESCGAVPVGDAAAITECLLHRSQNLQGAVIAYIGVNTAPTDQIVRDEYFALGIPVLQRAGGGGLLECLSVLKIQYVAIIE